MLLGVILLRYHVLKGVSAVSFGDLDLDTDSMGMGMSHFVVHTKPTLA